MPGATPKLTKSASESSSAPKREVLCNRRAMRPSRPSRIAASTMQPTANSSRPSMARRIAGSPSNSVRSGIARKPRRRRSSGSGSKGAKMFDMQAKIALPAHGGKQASTHAERAFRVTVADVGDDRFAAARGLPLCHQRPHPGGKVNVDAGAEADEADPLAGRDRVALAHEANDAPRDQPGDLHDRDGVLAVADHDAVP